MKINSIALVFSDIDPENARLAILIDPPLAEGVNFTEVEFEDQPCLALSGKVMAFLSFLKSQEKQPDGGSGSLIETIH